MSHIRGISDSGISGLSNGVYIHIPFCIRKCICCDFLSFPYDEPLAKKYIDALCTELSLKKNYAGKLKTVFIGGGTPSVLPMDCYRQLFKSLRDNFDFSGQVEITIETNPGTINGSKIDTLLSLGVNRISIGVQSFIDSELKTLGRIHTAEDAEKAVMLIKKAGLRNFSIDLMYGIPGQSIDNFKDSLAKAAGLSPTHVSSYELTPEKNTPLFRLIESGEIRMPGEELVLEMYSHVIDYLASKGFEHYEISNFALPGFRCLHNLNYWDRGEYIGAGAGAHSFIRGFRSRNTGNLKQYIEDLKNGKIPEAESMEIKRDDAIKEFIFLGLRKTEGLSFSKAEELGIDILNASKELVDDGYLEVSGNYLRLTRKGVVISNSIIVRIFEKLELE